MSGAALRVVQLPPVSETVHRLALVSQPRPTWRQLALVLSPDEAPRPVIEPSDDPRFDGMPDVNTWVRQLVVGLVEALAGVRPAQQLVRWLDAPVFQALVTRCRQTPAAAGPVRPTVSTVRAQSPRPGIVEATAVVKLGARYRAVAIRLRADEGRWKCAEVHLL